MKIVGCDLHTRYQQVALLDQELEGAPSLRVLCARVGFHGCVSLGIPGTQWLSAGLAHHAFGWSSSSRLR
jgi:hypothetical protein